MRFFNVSTLRVLFIYLFIKLRTAPRTFYPFIVTFNVVESPRNERKQSFSLRTEIIRQKKNEKKSRASFYMEPQSGKCSAVGFYCTVHCPTKSTKGSRPIRFSQTVSLYWFVGLLIVWTENSVTRQEILS